MFFNILGNLEPRPLCLCCSAPPTARPGRGQPWKYLRQRSAPRVTARRCPMRRTPPRRRQFEGRPLAGALSRGRVDGCWWGPSSAWTSGLASYLALQGGAAPVGHSGSDCSEGAPLGRGESLSFDAREGLPRSFVPDKGGQSVGVNLSEILLLAGTHSLNGPLHVRSTMEREVDVATFAPNADGVELKHRSPAGLGEAAARADRGEL